MLEGIDHVAIAVHSVDETLPTYTDLLGFECVAIEVVPDQKVRVAVLQKGAHKVELVEPSSPDSPITGFLEKRGPGLHHVCLDVSDLKGTLAKMKAAGARLIDEEPRPGAHGREIAFVHPKATGGVLIELSQPAQPAED